MHWPTPSSMPEKDVSARFLSTLLDLPPPRHAGPSAHAIHHHAVKKWMWRRLRHAHKSGLRRANVERGISRKPRRPMYDSKLRSRKGYLSGASRSDRLPRLLTVTRVAQLALTPPRVRISEVS